MAGPVYVEDNTLANALTDIFRAPGVAGAQIANVRSEIALREEQRRKLQLEMQKQREQQDAAAASIAAETARVRNMQPPPGLEPTWAKSGGTIGADQVPAGGALPLQLAPPNASEVPARDTAKVKEFNLERDKQLADFALGARHATSMSDVAGAAPKMEGQTRVALYGNAPPGSPEWTKTQTQLTGQQPVLETKNLGGYAVLDADGQVVSRGVTQNFRTDVNGAQINVPPGGSIVKMGEMPADTGPFKDEGARLAAINAGVQKVSRGQPIGQPEALTIAQALARQFPDVVKLEKNDVGTVYPVVVPEHPMARVYGPLVDHLNGIIGGAPAPAPAPAPSLQAPNVTPAQPPPEVPNVGGTAARPAAAAPAQPVTPIIPPVGTVAATPGPPIIQGTGQELQKELFNSQFYRQYSDAMIAYNNVKEALQSDNQSADLRAIYALAKLYDPGSVVREGELKLTQNASSMAERVAGLYNSLTGTGARLTKDQRIDIMQQAYGAARNQYESMNVKNTDAADRARRLGLDPKNVQVPIEAPQPPKPGEISVIKRGANRAQPLSRGTQPKGKYDDVDAIVGGQ